MLIGETRDARTAHNAMHASGHLVVTSLTPTCAWPVYRLAEMGIERFLIANAVTGVIAQRLVGRSARPPRAGGLPALARLEDLPEGQRRAPDVPWKGCSLQPTGYRGTAVLEVLQIIQELERDRLQGRRCRSFGRSRAAARSPSTTRFLISTGLTTPNEVLRVLYVEQDAESEKNMVMRRVRAREQPRQVLRRVRSPADRVSELCVPVGD